MLEYYVIDFHYVIVTLSEKDAILLSLDNPGGTGDHENYLKKTDAFLLSGEKFERCQKKAVNIRTKYAHEPWYSLSGIYPDITLLFSKDSKYTSNPLHAKSEDIFYTRTLSSDYG